MIDLFFTLDIYLVRPLVFSQLSINSFQKQDGYGWCALDNDYIWGGNSNAPHRTRVIFDPSERPDYI